MLGEALAVTLLFTLPSHNVRTWVDPSQGADSAMVSCYEEGAPLTDLGAARLYGWPADGGSPRVLAEHSAVGREGQPDSFKVSLDGNWHLWVTTLDRTGKESCPSPMLYFGTVTGVEPQPSDFDPPVAPPQIFDVHGRLVRGIPKASGVYFRRDRYESGSVVTRKIVVVK